MQAVLMFVRKATSRANQGSAQEQHRQQAVEGYAALRFNLAAAYLSCRSVQTVFASCRAELRSELASSGTG